MKKKFLIGGAALLFAAVTALNMDLLQSNKARDVSLENMISTANANSEVSNGCLYCEVSNGCLFCGGDGVRSGGSTCTYCSAGNRNTGWTILSQGFTKDEREYERPCPTYEDNRGSGSVSGKGYSASGRGSHTQINPSGRMEITCPYGNENCTKIPC
jgi:hypothetical protein